MDRLLAIGCFLLGAASAVLVFPDGAVAAIVALLAALVLIFLIRGFMPEDRDVLVRVFLLALLARISFGLFIHYFDLRPFFGGDAETYDYFGNMLALSWTGKPPTDFGRILLNIKMSGVGWGMYYFVASMYSIIGRNILAAQYLAAVFGAASAPLIFVVARQIFGNRRVAMISSVLVATSPAFIVWTGQLLKDGLIIFLLLFSFMLVLKLKERLNFVYVGVLLVSLFGIYSLRSYIFYLVAFAIVGSMIISFGQSQKVLIARILILGVLAVSITFTVGMPENTGDVEMYSNLQRIQQSRLGLSRAGSGFGKDVDVSTTRGAVQAVPAGFVYLMFAPFPWHITSARALAAFPDVVVWWVMMPFLITGLLYTLKNKLKGSLGILMFSSMLTLAYSVFQGNVGTAYRQRTQIQVFLFIFVAVGITLWIEKRENRRLIRESRRAGMPVRGEVTQTG